MFKMQISTQTDDHKERENIGTVKKYALRKMGLKFRNL